MSKKFASVLLAATLVMGLGLTACGPKEEKKPEVTKAAVEKETKAEEKKEEEKKEEKKDAPAPGTDSGFNEITIGEDKIAGPFMVAAVYFQAVDMVPENRQPSAEESDMHLEADIVLTEEAGKAYGWGADSEGAWPAYLTVNYKVLTPDGKEVTSGTMMPMNADDGPHYGINVKKGLIPVGQYKLVLEIQPSSDYLLHVDGETGVPAAKDGPNASKAAAEQYYTKQTVEFDWNYDASQLTNK